MCRLDNATVWFESSDPSEDDTHLKFQFALMLHPRSQPGWCPTGVCGTAVTGWHPLSLFFYFKPQKLFWVFWKMHYRWTLSFHIREVETLSSSPCVYLAEHQGFNNCVFICVCFRCNTSYLFDPSPFCLVQPTLNAQDDNIRWLFWLNFRIVGGSGDMSSIFTYSQGFKVVTLLVKYLVFALVISKLAWLFFATSLWDLKTKFETSLNVPFLHKWASCIQFKSSRYLWLSLDTKY